MTDPNCEVLDCGYLRAPESTYCWLHNQDVELRKILHGLMFVAKPTPEGSLAWNNELVGALRSITELFDQAYRAEMEQYLAPADTEPSEAAKAHSKELKVRLELDLADCVSRKTLMEKLEAWRNWARERLEKGDETGSQHNYLAGLATAYENLYQHAEALPSVLDGE